MPQTPRRNGQRGNGWSSRSLFFLGALAFHLAALLIVAKWIIWPAPPPEPDIPHLVSLPAAETQPSPPSNTAQAHPAPLASAPASSIELSPAMTGSFPAPLIPSLDAATDSSGGLNAPATPAIAPRLPNGLDARIPGIEDTVRTKWHRSERAIADHDPAATFPVYVASYADGDWACNTRLDAQGNIIAGGIPDLVAKISEWSDGQVDGKLMPKPLDIASPELLEQMPAFIFFTGHKDFVLTQKEIDNLDAYLLRGGAIWGDNALAGEGSRFDIAFHREMKRVVPDADKQFQPFSLSDDLFTKGSHPITEIPAGMNYYRELPQHLDIDHEVAIVYTPNDYSDILFLHVLPGDRQVELPPRKGPPTGLYTNGDFWYHQNVYYRNFNLDSALAVHHFGMNLVSYLLTRFDNILLLDR